MLLSRLVTRPLQTSNCFLFDFRLIGFDKVESEPVAENRLSSTNPPPVEYPQKRVNEEEIPLFRSSSHQTLAREFDVALC